MKTKEQIIEFAKSIGISNIGFTKAEIFHELLPILIGRGFVPFVKSDLYMRINPFMYLKTARSVIAIAVPYIKYDDNDENKKIAKYAKGGDYHPYVKEKMKQITDFIGDGKFKRFVDSGGLCDKYIAYKAGIGFFGKNNLLYNKENGSRFYIGIILTENEYEYDRPVKSKCLNCNKCINACPGKALGNGFNLDYKKCASYINQMQEETTEEQKKILSKSGYSLGCDICSDVCPLNKELIK